MKISMGKIILLFISIFTIVYAGTHIQILSAVSNNGENTIKWQVTEQKNLDHFVIYRKNGESNSTWSSIKTLSLREAYVQNEGYEYTDPTAYKITNPNDLVFVYKVACVDNNNREFDTAEATVTSVIAGYKRTWGSIKALFR